MSAFSAVTACAIASLKFLLCFPERAILSIIRMSWNAVETVLMGRSGVGVVSEARCLISRSRSRIWSRKNACRSMFLVGNGVCIYPAAITIPSGKSNDCW